MSETAVMDAKKSGLNAAVGSTIVDSLKRHGLIALLLLFGLWRVDGWVHDLREENKNMSRAVMTFAENNAKIVQENTTQSKQTQAAIESFANVLRSDRSRVYIPPKPPLIEEN